MHEEVFGPDERYRIDDRLRRLNELGFDVEEMELVAGPDGVPAEAQPAGGRAGPPSPPAARDDGLRAQEKQARRLLNDLARYRAYLEDVEGRPLPTSVAAARWLMDVFEPAIAAIPPELHGKREAAEMFHEILEHRWYLSQSTGKDVGLMPAVASYVDTVLRNAVDERTVLEED